MEENKNDKNKKKKKFIQCENCEEERPAVVWCETCAVYYCGDCGKNIHSAKATRSHVRLSLNEKKKKPSFSKCEKHMEENKFYCLTCNCLICNVCVIDYHPQHRTMSIFKYAETLKNNLNTSLSDIVECINLFKRQEETFENDIKNLNTKKQNLTKELKQIDEDLMKKKLDKEKNIQQRKKIETSHIVLKNSVQEMGVMDLMNKDSRELMQNRINKITTELCPQDLKQQLKNNLYSQENYTYEEEENAYPQNTSNWHSRSDNDLEYSENYPREYQCEEGFLDDLNF
jgi:tripartite motif-containing protein 46